MPALEQAKADQLDENAALLAHHWAEAGEPVAAARWYARAAKWVGTNDVVAAYAHWSQARELLRDAPESPESTGLDFFTVTADAFSSSEAQV